MNIDFECQETEHLILNDEKNYNIENKIAIYKKKGYFIVSKLYYLFIICLIIWIYYTILTHIKN